LLFILFVFSAQFEERYQAEKSLEKTKRVEISSAAKTNVIPAGKIWSTKRIWIPVTA